MSTPASASAAASDDGRPRRRSERARLAILRAANELLHENGLDQFSIEGVAARAGVGKQTIYRWWPNRAALAADALLDRDDLVPTSPKDTGDAIADLGDWAGDLAVAMGSTRGASTMRMLTAAATENEEISRRLHDKFSGPLQEQAMARVASAPDLTATYEERRAAVDAIIGLILFRVLAHQEVGRADAADLVRALTVGLRGSAEGRPLARQAPGIPVLEALLVRVLTEGRAGRARAGQWLASRLRPREDWHGGKRRDSPALRARHARAKRAVPCRA